MLCWRHTGGCVCRYVASNPQYADSTAYAGKFRQLHGRALATVRAKVQQVMRHASEQVRMADPAFSQVCWKCWACSMWLLGLLALRKRRQLSSAFAQVQAAITEAKASSSGRRKAEGNGGAPASNGLVRSGSGNAKVPLAEGAETALLYVRFRAAAEPGLKGAHTSRTSAVPLDANTLSTLDKVPPKSPKL